MADIGPFTVDFPLLLPPDTHSIGRQTRRISCGSCGIPHMQEKIIPPEKNVIILCVVTYVLCIAIVKWWYRAVTPGSWINHECWGVLGRSPALELWSRCFYTSGGDGYKPGIVVVLVSGVLLYVMTLDNVYTVAFYLNFPVIYSAVGFTHFFPVKLVTKNQKSCVFWSEISFFLHNFNVCIRKSFAHYIYDFICKMNNYLAEYHGQAGMDSGNADFDPGMFTKFKPIPICNVSFKRIGFALCALIN